MAAPFDMKGTHESLEMSSVPGKQHNVEENGDGLSKDDRKQGLSSDEALPPPATAIPVLQRWNHPRQNMWRVFATFYSFIILGVNDAAYGALIPYLETYYKVNYTIISLVFLSPMGGYVISALLLNKIHMTLGQRGIAVCGALAHLVAYIVICLHPPYPVLVILFIIAGYGNGALDGAWNAWIGDMANCNEVLGFLHAFYGLGAALAPLVATSVITKAGWQWFEFYYIMVGASVLELVLLTTAFWSATGEEYRNQHPYTTQEVSNTESAPVLQKGRKKWLLFGSRIQDPDDRFTEAIKNKITWMAASFLLVYVGIEVAIGGWTVTFMLKVRHGAAFESGMTSTGFWLGVTIGRVVLGFVTARAFKTEKHAIVAYLLITMGLTLVYWLVPQFVVSAIAVALIGFFIAPLFPAAVVVATKLLPKRLHVASIGFAAALGASGACAIPFAVGAIAQARGVWVLMPITLAMLVLDLGIWLMIPKLPKVRQA